MRILDSGFPVVAEFTHAGYECNIAINALFFGYPSKDDYQGHNGYVQLTSGHPILNHTSCECFEKERPCISNTLEVHGGITYSRGRVIGFDTAHGDDFKPWSSPSDTDFFGNPLHKWTLQEVIDETKRLAEQCADIANAGHYTI